MTLLEISAFMFFAAASGGLLFTLLIGLRKRYPRALPTGHGILGLGALVLLYFELSRSATPVSANGLWAAGALSATWFGGFFLFRVLRPAGRRLTLALMHGSLALLGLYLLYQFIVQQT
jgi:hypothetical protein